MMFTARRDPASVRFARFSRLARARYMVRASALQHEQPDLFCLILWMLRTCSSREDGGMGTALKESVRRVHRGAGVIPRVALAFAEFPISEDSTCPT
jgi:hypothetical protein